MFRFLNDVDDDPYMMTLIWSGSVNGFVDPFIDVLHQYTEACLLVFDLTHELLGSLDLGELKLGSRDPFAAHRQQMRLMFGPFGMDPFALAPQIQAPRAPRRQAGQLAPFGMMGMGGGGFMDMFGMMGEMMGNVERMSGSPNCQTFSSSTVISYSSSDTGPPEVYQQTSATRTGPGGLRETRQSMRDSESGLERLAIGHHLGDRGHVMERSRNRRTGDREERQDFINLDETDAASFDEEWRREAGRYAPPSARGLDYGRDRRGGGQQLALTAPPTSTSPPGHRLDSPRHRQPQTRPRYDW